MASKYPKIFFSFPVPLKRTIKRTGMLTFSITELARITLIMDLADFIRTSQNSVV